MEKKSKYQILLRFLVTVIIIKKRFTRLSMGETHPIRKGRRVLVERLVFSNDLNVCVKGEERVRKDLQRMTQ